jgi:uncharacterized protein (TIGR03382 family)
VFAIAVTASDVTGPNLTVTAPTTWEAIADYVVSADVSDTSGVAQLNLWVRAPAGSWTSYPFPDPSAATRTYRYSTANLAVGQPYMDVYVEAVDNIGNSTVFPVGGAGSPRRVAISYPDIEAPVVTVADPGAQTEGTGFTVEIDATDVSGEVTSVVLYYRRAGSGGWSSVDAVEVGAGSYEADVPGVAVTVGTLEFYATATDDSDNLGISDTRSVSVNVAPDVTAPSISVSAVPNGQPAGTAVTVSATVTDDRGITSVTLRYRAQGGTIFTNLAMTGVGPVYSAQIPAGSVNVPGLEYQVSATDTSANSATSTTFAFTVTAVDAAGPSIAHTPVTSAVEGSNVTLTATVSDSSGVDHGAVVTVVAISGAAPGIISSSWAGDQWTGVLGPVAVGSFGYYLTFSDTLGNVSRSPSSAPGTRHTVNVTPIVVADVTAPTIVTDSIVTPQMEGIDVTVVATVTDASGVDTVTLFYANESDVDFTGVEMTPIGGNRFRAAMLASNLEVGRVDFFVEASDTVGNTGTDPSDAPESVYAFEVEGLEPVDTTPPVIVHVPVDTAPSGVRLRVEAVITDATGVAGATLYAREAGEASFVTFAMTGVGGNVWYADVPVFLTRGSAVEYYVASTDSSPAANRGVAPDGAPAAVFETTFEVVGDDVGSDTVDGDTAGDAGDDAEVDADVADTSDDAADTVDDVEVSDASDAASDTDADLDTIETDTATDAADDSQDDAQDDAVSTDIGTDATGDTTADAGTDSDGGSESDGTGSESDVDDGTDGGGAAGGCASTRPAGGAWVLGFLALVLMRRRRKA